MKNEENVLKENDLEIVIAAAVMYENEIILGLTHSRCAYEKDKAITYTKSYDIKTDYWGTQFGYITNRGRFVLAQTAWELADVAGFLDENPQSFTRYSEDYFNICGKYFDLIEAKRIIKENCEKEYKEATETQSSKKISDDNIENKNGTAKKIELKRKK